MGAGSAAAEAPSGLMYSYSGESFRSRSERSSAALSRMSGRFRTFSCVSLASKAKAVKCAWKNKVYVALFKKSSSSLSMPPQESGNSAGMLTGGRFKVRSRSPPELTEVE